MNGLLAKRAQFGRTARRRRGFSLVESVIATGIFAIVLLGTIQSFVQFHESSRRVSETAIAHGLAMEIAEQIKNTADLYSVAYGGTINTDDNGDPYLVLPGDSSELLIHKGAGPPDNPGVHPILSLEDASGDPIPVLFGIEIIQDGSYSRLRTVKVRVVWPSTRPGHQRTHEVQTTVCQGYMRF